MRTSHARRWALLALTSLAGGAVADPAAAARPWMEVRRGGAVTEVLWLEEGGVLEYVRYEGGRVLGHGRGLLPGERFRQLRGLLQASAAAGAGDAGATLHDAGGARALDLAGAPELTADLFRLATVLLPAGGPGTYLRLGSAQDLEPAGLVLPVPGKPPEAVRELRRLPGRFVFVADADLSDVFGALHHDDAGAPWLEHAGRWWPVELFARPGSS